MANYTCEESSICPRFQSAICLHCNRRLCLEHISEHNKMIYSSTTSLSNEVQTTFQQLKEESEKRRDIFNNIITSFDQWQTEQIEKIQQIYDKHMKLIEYQRENLNKAEVKLFEQLEENALQPLELIKRQQNASVEIIEHIRQTIKQVREDNAYLKWKLAIPPPPTDVEFSALDIPPVSLPIDSSKSDNNKSTSSRNPTNLENGCPFKRLVAIFANISSIEKSKKDAVHYIENLGRDNFRLPIIICSYLTAWHKKSNIDAKVFLLNEHIITIQKYLSKRKSEFDVIIGIQAFFHNHNIKENSSDMMTFLLQFFLNHQCLTQQQILNWYHHKDIHGYKGYDHAKHIAALFIQSLSTNQTVNNIQIVSINSTSIDQSFDMKIKQELV